MNFTRAPIVIKTRFNPDDPEEITMRYGNRAGEMIIIAFKKDAIAYIGYERLPGEYQEVIDVAQSALDHGHTSIVRDEDGMLNVPSWVQIRDINETPWSFLDK